MATALDEAVSEARLQEALAGMVAEQLGVADVVSEGTVNLAVGRLVRSS